ncbi:MAG: ester cyclase [Desulfosarcinaceae bacterium]|nr:ester cyclase [Desulfosarcinaceae bacterium]
MDTQSAKDLIWKLWQRLTLTDGPKSFVLPQRTAFSDAIVFYGPAPIGTLDGPEAIFDEVYAPLAESFPQVRRQPYLFLGGSFEGRTWVATTGDFVGQMAHAWLGIPAPIHPVRLRFGEFYCIEEGRISEIRCLFDILGLAAQAGYPLLPPFEGRAEVPPGPQQVDGVCISPQDPVETAKTLDLVEGMIGGCNRLDGDDWTSMGMDAFWHPDMVWHGPWGIGSCYGFQEFRDYAQGPSVASFPNRRGGFHRARFADGVTAAFTGWPSLRGTFTGAPFHGAAPTGRPIGMNIMDFYVRRDDRLFENWVLIDLIDAWQQFGIDLMDALQKKVAQR